MKDLEGAAIDLLLAEAEALGGQCRYAGMAQASSRAVALAQAADDLPRQIRATSLEATALRMLGDKEGALSRYTWILGVTRDPRHAAVAGQDAVQQDIALAFMNWVECARFLPTIEVRGLFEVLDEGERWLRGVGRSAWRHGLLWQRARLLQAQERWGEALDAAQEALALRQRDPTGPGYTLATLRWFCGDLLRQLGRTEEAARQYRAVLDDPRSDEYDRSAAHEGLARVLHGQGAWAEAEVHAREALTRARPMGDDACCTAWEVLLAVQRARADREGARATVSEWLTAARKLGSEYRLYFALRNALDVALDDADRGRAQALLDEVTPLARTLDTQGAVSSHSQEIRARQERLDALVMSGGAPSGGRA